MDNLNEWLEGQDNDYTYRTEIYKEILNQYSRYLGHVFTNIGGIIVNEKKVGDKLPHFEIVSRERQSTSLQFLLDQIYDLDWLDNKAFLRNLPLQTSYKDNIRNQLAKLIVSSGKRVHFGSTKTNDPYTTKECLTDLYKRVFKSLDSRNTPSNTDIVLQKAFVDEMIKVAEIDKKPSNMMANLIAEDLDIEQIRTKYEESPPKGFELWVLINYDLGDVEKNIFYEFLLKTGKALKRRINSCTEEAKLHYQLLLKSIEKSKK